MAFLISQLTRQAFLIITYQHTPASAFKEFGVPIFGNVKGLIPCSKFQKGGIIYGKTGDYIIAQDEKYHVLDLSGVILLPSHFDVMALIKHKSLAKRFVPVMIDHRTLDQMNELMIDNQINLNLPMGINLADTYKTILKDLSSKIKVGYLQLDYTMPQVQVEKSAVIEMPIMVEEPEVPGYDSIHLVEHLKQHNITLPSNIDEIFRPLIKIPDVRAFMSDCEYCAELHYRTERVLQIEPLSDREEGNLTIGSYTIDALRAMSLQERADFNATVHTFTNVNEISEIVQATLSKIDCEKETGEVVLDVDSKTKVRRELFKDLTEDEQPVYFWKVMEMRKGTQLYRKKGNICDIPKWNDYVMESDLKVDRRGYLSYTDYVLTVLFDAPSWVILKFT